MVPKQNDHNQMHVELEHPSGTPLLHHGAALAPMDKKRVTVIHCWTAPRSRSTALLYSFEARGEDCVAIDEPLKREWLVYQGDNVQRPYKTNMIDGTPPADKPQDSYLWERETLPLGERIHLAALKLSKSTENDDTSNNNECVIFCKHMSKTYFLYDFDNDVHVEPVEGVELVHKHMFLIRDPVAILRSWDVLNHVHNESCSTEDVGIVPLLSIYSTLQRRFGSESHITILDSDALVKDPEGVLQDICQELDIPYKDSMMTWEAGVHECDSRHAPWWYPNAHASSGWLRVPKDGDSKKSGTSSPLTASQSKPINPKLLPALKDSFPAYEMLMLAQQCRRTVAKNDQI